MLLQLIIPFINILSVYKSQSWLQMARLYSGYKCPLLCIWTQTHTVTKPCFATVTSQFPCLLFLTSVAISPLTHALDKYRLNFDSTGSALYTQGEPSPKFLSLVVMWSNAEAGQEASSTLREKVWCACSQTLTDVTWSRVDERLWGEEGWGQWAWHAFSYCRSATVYFRYP
jgi:hypothetical protein